MPASFFDCCLNSNKQDGCENLSGNYSLEFTNNNYEYGTNCSSLFNDAYITSYKSDHSNLLTGENNYGYDRYLSDYIENYNLAKNWGYPIKFNSVFYALHSTNEQLSSDGNNKNYHVSSHSSDNLKNIDKIYSDSNYKLDYFVKHNLNNVEHNLEEMCSTQPYRYWKNNSLSASLCNINEMNEINFNGSDVENGSDLCMYKINSDGSINNNEIETNSSDCENKYLEWTTDKFSDLNVDPSKNIPYYPSFTKYVKCRYDNGSCTMSKRVVSASLVNECLEYTGCTKDNFNSYKCDNDDISSIEKYTLDFFTTKGYNRQYSNLCSCAYDNSDYYKIMYDDYYSFICKSYGVDDVNIGKCINAFKDNDVKKRSNHEICQSLVSPCSNATIKNYDDCAKKDNDQYIQICSQRISQFGDGTINANTSIDCNQKITDLNNNAGNASFLSSSNSTNLTPSPKQTNITTVPSNTTVPPTKPDDTTVPSTKTEDNTSYIIGFILFCLVCLGSYIAYQSYYKKKELSQSPRSLYDDPYLEEQVV
uniref:Uncharacterized protein n=1 Tax=viral metagenome TaxID=1070528 RepID=A0A6C0CXY2_9ZZZZ